MPIDPSIALSVKPAQFEDPINMMGRYAQLQQAQSANQLNALKMDEYQRGVQQQNALRSALTGVDINTPEGRLSRDQAYVNQGMLDKLQEVKKSEAEVENLLSKSAEARTDNITKRIALSKIRLEGVKTPQDYLAWHEQNHTDPVLNDYYKSIGVNKDEALARIQAASKDPVAFQQMLLDSKVGVTNSMKNHILSQDTGATTRLISAPEYGPGAATVVPGSTVTKTLSPEAAAANARAAAAQSLLERKFAYEKANPGYTVQEAGDGSLIAVNKNNPKDVQPVSMGGVPVQKMPEAAKKEIMSINQQRSTINGALNALQEAPDAFSYKRGAMGKVSESLAGRTETPAQTQARAYVFNNVSSVIKERAGAAQSAQELQRINSFLPSDTDNATQIQNKLTGFLNYLNDLEAGTKGQPTQVKKPGGAWSVVK